MAVNIFMLVIVVLTGILNLADKEPITKLSYLVMWIIACLYWVHKILKEDE